MKDSGRDRKMVRKKKACKCLQVISLAAFVVFLFIFSLASLSDKQIRNMVKNYHGHFEILIYIEYFEDGDTVFACCPYIQVLVDDYFYGFYYSQSDQPRGLKKRWDNELVYETTDSEGTYERESNSSYYWYHTEKILNHWWYFELIMS